jgi:hypothetical protein
MHKKHKYHKYTLLILISENARQKKEPFSHWDWGRYSAPKTQSENY